MNERMQELHNMAAQWLDDPMCDFQGEDWSIPEEYTKKFAELIVLKCCELLDQEIKKIDPDDAVMLLKNHFDVK